MKIPKEVVAERKRYKDWLAAYKPLNDEGFLAEYDATPENRLAVNEVKPDLVWSMVQGDDGGVIVNGLFEHPEVFSWIVAQRPWLSHPGAISIRLAMSASCGLCNGTGRGKPDNPCEECLGDGYKIYELD